MLEYFTYKKVKKHQAEKKAASQPSTPQLQPPAPIQTRVRTPSPSGPRPILNDEDANFLERIVSAEGPAPPLPDRPQGWVPGVGMEAGDPTGNKAQLVMHDSDVAAENQHWYNVGPLKGKEKENEATKTVTSPAAEKKPERFAFLMRTFTKKNKEGLKPAPVIPPAEALSEEEEMNRVLEDLNLSAVNNRAFSLSKESQQLVAQFTVILKDLINGVPTAYDDLTHLLDDKQGTLSKSYESLPSFLKKLITQLPDKLKNNLAPELLAVASEAAALESKGAFGGATSFSDAAKSFLTPTSLKDLVTKPGAIVSMLKAIMNALKLRWPAFMGTNVLLSLGLFVLLFVFWYCHKRGRETRLEREAKVDSEGRIIELDDDPMIGESSEAGPSRPAGAERSQTERSQPQASSREPSGRTSEEEGEEKRTGDRSAEHVSERR